MKSALTISGLTGENGAGKSTTINAALGLIGREAGRVSISSSEELDSGAKEEIGVVFDGSNYPDIRSPRKISAVMKRIYRSWDEAAFFQLLKKLSLPPDKQIRQFSKGMKMKLAISAALSHHSRLLILDEATSGLDPVTRDELLDLFYEFIQDEQHSIFMSSHITSDLEKICDYVTYIHKGKLLLCQEKDRLLGRMGILKCSEALFRDIDPAAVHGKRTTAFGVEALVERQKIPASFTVEHASLDDILIYLVKEDPLHAKNHITHF